MVRIKRLGKFTLTLEKLLFDNPDLEVITDKKIALFLNNPSDTRLDNHPLTKTMGGKWAFSITDDVRIVYQWLSRTTVRFLEIGPHTIVYIKAKKQLPKR